MALLKEFNGRKDAKNTSRPVEPPHPATLRVVRMTPTENFTIAPQRSEGHLGGPELHHLPHTSFLFFPLLSFLSFHVLFLPFPRLARYLPLSFFSISSLKMSSRVFTRARTATIRTSAPLFVVAPQLLASQLTLGALLPAPLAQRTTPRKMPPRRPERPATAPQTNSPTPTLRVTKCCACHANAAPSAAFPFPSFSHLVAVWVYGEGPA